MNSTQITFARYCTSVDIDGNAAASPSSIRATIDGQELFVPLDPSNRHYAEIMRQVDAGELVIQEAQ